MDGYFNGNNSNDDDQEYSFNFTGWDEGSDTIEYENTNTISGIGVVNEEEEDNGISLDDLLKNVNEQNADSFKEEQERQKKELEEQERQDAQIRKEAFDRLLQERYEKEQAEREKRRQEEEEEERRLAEEAEAKRKANPLFKLKDAAANMAAKPKKEKNEQASEVEITETAVSDDLESNPGVIVSQTEENQNVSEEADGVPSVIGEEAENKEEKKKGFGKPLSLLSKPQKEKEPKPAKEPRQAKPQKTKEPAQNTEELDYKYLATHDQLTGVKNFTAYEMDTKNKSAKGLVVLFADINNLKVTNDKLGHDMGNRLITTVAQALEKQFPQSVYRIGGDEFVIFYEGKEKAAEKKVSDFQSSLEKAQKKDPDGLEFSVSVGYVVGSAGKGLAELQKEAEQEMYKQKEEYKAAHAPKEEPKQNPDSKKPGGMGSRQKKELPPVDYDSMLTDEQRMLKGVIKDNHNQAPEESTEKILREIQSRCNEIIAILVASPTFDHLFVLQNVESFIELVAEMDNLIDYSYLYVVYEGGTQFYGIDEYFDEVTGLFQEIGRVVKSGPYVSDKEPLKIKGINIFKNIYID